MTNSEESPVGSIAWRDLTVDDAAGEVEVPARPLVAQFIPQQAGIFIR